MIHPGPVFPTTIRALERAANDNRWPMLPRSPFGVCLFRGDSLDIMDDLARAHPDGLVDMVFADPPYRLSNDGMTCRNGSRASVNKAEWDRSRGDDLDHEWNRAWLLRCHQLMKPDATIWVTASQHILFSVGMAVRELGMKILNVISWEKPDPPPNLSHRVFTHSTEFLIWAARSPQSRHRFNYGSMCELAGGRQMQTVWRIAPPDDTEKRLGRHPTQKPLALVRRAIFAATARGDVILDPFVGSGTTAVAAVQAGRQCVGLDSDAGYLDLAGRRVEAVLRTSRS
jgi:site-specific DNA-methyltransferase (adenine-specific)